MRPTSAARPLLIFPPLVETSFGSCYPSTAVLDAYLRCAGIESDQIDLNERFAMWLLDEERLDRAARGDFAPATVTEESSLPAIAARWLRQHKGDLFDAEGRHAFATSSEPGFLVAEVAKPYRVDPELDDLAIPERRVLLDASIGLAFHDFYASALADLPAGEDPPLVGISVPMGPQLYPALLLSELLHERWSDTRIVLGGPTFSLMQDDDLATLLGAYPSVDAVVRFDGEEPLLTLVRQAIGADSGWAPHEVAGVSVEHDGVVVHVPPRPGPALATLPSAQYADEIVSALADPELGVTQARGCYWGKCDYCDYVELYGVSKPFRGRHPDAVVDELEDLHRRYGVTRFTLITESIPPAFARRFAQLLIDRNLPIQWTSFAMVDRRFDAELLRLVAQSGCRCLYIGMESMTTRVLDLVHKSADRDENIRFLQDARRAGVSLRVNLIPNLPSTTYEEALRSLADVAEYGDCIDGIEIFPFEPTRSSNVGRHPERFGYVPARQREAGQSQYAINHLLGDDPAMSDEERSAVLDRFQSFAQHHKYTVAQGKASSRRRAPSGSARMQVTVRYLDVLEKADVVHYTNVVTLDRLVVDVSTHRRLAGLLTGRPFDPADLEANFLSGDARSVLDALASAHLLESFADGA